MFSVNIPFLGRSVERSLTPTVGKVLPLMCAATRKHTIKQTNKQTNPHPKILEDPNSVEGKSDDRDAHDQNESLCAALIPSRTTHGVPRSGQSNQTQLSYPI